MGKGRLHSKQLDEVELTYASGRCHLLRLSVPARGVAAPRYAEGDDEGDEAEREAEACRAPATPEMLWQSDARAFRDEQQARPAPASRVLVVEEKVGECRFEDAFPKLTWKEARQQADAAVRPSDVRHWPARSAARRAGRRRGTPRPRASPPRGFCNDVRE